MSSTAAAVGQVDVNHNQTQLYSNTNTVTAASGESGWTLTLVLRDKPDVASPMNVSVWSEQNACTAPGSVPPAQQYASGAVTVPAKGFIQLSGVSISVPGTGAVARSLANGEKLCLRLNPNGASGNNDVHFSTDTAALLDLIGSESQLQGPFNGG